MEKDIMKLATTSTLELYTLYTILNDENKYDIDVKSKKGIHNITIRIKGESADEIKSLRKDIELSLSAMRFNNISKE